MRAPDKKCVCVCVSMNTSLQFTADEIGRIITFIQKCPAKIFPRHQYGFPFIGFLVMNKVDRAIAVLTEWRDNCGLFGPVNEEESLVVLAMECIIEMHPSISEDDFFDEHAILVCAAACSRAGMAWLTVGMEPGNLNHGDHCVPVFMWLSARLSPFRPYTAKANLCGITAYQCPAALDLLLVPRLVSTCAHAYKEECGQCYHWRGALVKIIAVQAGVTPDRLDDALNVVCHILGLPADLLAPHMLCESENPLDVLNCYFRYTTIFPSECIGPAFIYIATADCDEQRKITALTLIHSHLDKDIRTEVMVRRIVRSLSEMKIALRQLIHLAIEAGLFTEDELVLSLDRLNVTEDAEDDDSDAEMS